MLRNFPKRFCSLGSCTAIINADNNKTIDMKLIDMTGQRFGRLVVIKKGETRKGGGSNWVCACDCGGSIVAIGSNIRQGHTRSCGCLAHEHAVSLGSNPEYIRKRAQSVVQHGHKRRSGATVEYKTWLRMKRRCLNDNHKDYANWGGRGIKVCDRWIESFEAFLDDMGPRPAGRYSIDRINPNGNYEPGNCRWATIQEQGAENRRGLLPVTVHGVSYPNLKAACAAFRMPYTSVVYRLGVGTSIEEALTTPIGKRQIKRSRDSYLPKSKRA